MNLLKKLLPEFTYNELVKRTIEEGIYLRLLPVNKPNEIKKCEKNLELLHKELDKRNIKKIRKQKLNQINASHKN